MELSANPVAGRAFHTEAINEVIFSSPLNNTPHNTLNVTLWLENPYRIKQTYQHHVGDLVEQNFPYHLNHNQDLAN